MITGEELEAMQKAVEELERFKVEIEKLRDTKKIFWIERCAYVSLIEKLESRILELKDTEGENDEW